MILETPVRCIIANGEDGERNIAIICDSAGVWTVFGPCLDQFWNPICILILDTSVSTASVPVSVTIMYSTIHQRLTSLSVGNVKA